MGDYTIKHTEYPAPVTEAELLTMRQEKGISEEKYDFIGRFLTVCANLYGAMEMRECWAVYQKAARLWDMPMKVIRADFRDTFEILRRDDSLWFRIYTRNELDDYHIVQGGWMVAVLIHEDIMWQEGYLERLALPFMHHGYFDDPPHISDRFMSFLDHPQTKEEEALLAFLNGLKVDEKFSKPRDGMFTETHAGERLDSFSWISDAENKKLRGLWLGLDGVKRDANQAKALEKKLARESAAERALQSFRYGLQAAVGKNVKSPLRDFISFLKKELHVSLTQKQETDLAELSVAFSNVLPRWAGKGLSPLESYEDVLKLTRRGDTYRLTVLDPDELQEEEERRQEIEDRALQEEMLKQWKGQNDFTYPEPLTDKGLRSLARKNKVTLKALRFLDTYFEACAYVNGAVTIRDCWEMYKYALEDDWEDEIPEIHMTDFKGSLEILRQKGNTSYRILTQKELTGRKGKHDSWMKEVVIGKNIMNDTMEWRAAVMYLLAQMDASDSYNMPDGFPGELLYHLYEPDFDEELKIFKKSGSKS